MKIHDFRYIGSNREIAVFEQYRQAGPIVKLVPMKAGKGAVFAVLSDPNYEVTPVKEPSIKCINMLQEQRERSIARRRHENNKT